MEQIHIAELNPELAGRDSKHFRAAVTLIWPYSSSRRQFALLLAEPEFRLRRRKGQVRARFSGSSAKALATTGVGIGDEVVLSVRGAQFVKEGTVDTPGRSIDWELEYSQTVAVQVFRDGNEIANLELSDAAPTPAARSPVRVSTSSVPSPTQQWSSPAFLKRARLSDGPFFEAPYDPLADEFAEGHDKKRRRKSYRDWKAWTYTARTPSPDKEDAAMEDGTYHVDASPSRPTQLPRTPISPPKHDNPPIAAGPLHGSVHADEQVAETPKVPDEGDFVRDEDYYDLYAGPDEVPPADAPYAFGGDTEVNTEDEEEALEDTDAASLSATEIDTELEDDQPHERASGHDEVTSDPLDRRISEAGPGSDTEEDSLAEVLEERDATEITVEDPEVAIAKPKHMFPVDGTSVAAMPLPTLPTLNTAFPAPALSSMLLTPVGKEPSSPTLKPLDSALLPLPSPFPGRRDSNTACFLDEISTDVHPLGLDVDDQEPESEADYILENSFFSSIGSSRSKALHPDHESAFTPVRFTFGAGSSRPLDLSHPIKLSHSVDNSRSLDLSRPLDLSSPVPTKSNDDPYHESAFTPVRFSFGLDGAGFSRSMNVSSPFAAEPMDVYDAAGHNDEDAAQSDPNAQYKMPETMPLYSPASEKFTESLSAPIASVPDIPITVTKTEASDDIVVVEEVSDRPISREKPKEAEVIELSSDSESEATEEGDDDEDDLDENEGSTEDSFDEIEKSTENDIEDSDEDEEGPEQEVIHHTPERDRFASLEHAGPTSTTQSSTVSAMVHLGSPSGTSDEEDLDPGSQGYSENGDETVENTPPPEGTFHLDQDHHFPTVDNVRTETTQYESHSELKTMDHASAISDFVASTPEVAVTHTPTQEDIPAAPEAGEGSHLLVSSDPEPQTGMEIPDTYMEDNFLEDAPLWEPQIVEKSHPDVKLESIEDGSMFQLGSLETQHMSGEEESDEMFIAIPGNGHKLGELQTVSVPATAPARNTRSKAKTSMPPTKQDFSPPRRATRSTRSKASITPVAQTTMSPPRTRTRSAMSPSQDEAQVSPYSLRSQSKMLSPSESTSATAAVTRKSPRKHASQRSVESIPHVGPSQLHDLDPFLTSFEPSQELGASQGRYSNVSLVKDSEEESLDSEHSISTVKYSDDWNMFTNFSDPLVEQDQVRENLKSPPATAPELGNRTKGKATWPRSEPLVVVHIRSSPAQSQAGSPSRKLRSAGSTRVASSSPRIVRASRQIAQIISSSPSQQVEELSDEHTPKPHKVAYPALPSEGETTELRSSPPLDIGEIMRSSPPANVNTFATLGQQSAINSNRPITPEATQQSNMESQLSLVGQQQQALPMTPQLTQGTSAGLRSFNKSFIPEPTFDQPSTLVTKSTPRRNAPSTSAASPSPIPKAHSPDVSSDAPTAIDQFNTPSIGLSTPLAYYTPLNALSFFLNRSPQFHTSSNPDVLALVTSATSTPIRSTKGRKDYNTTLRITDISTWPSTMCVNIFRPYANALPGADVGDVVLLRGFAVKSVKRDIALVSTDESSWCVWRYKTPVWGRKKGVFGEVRAREEIKGPEVERGEGEWREVERVREWFEGRVRGEMEGREKKRKNEDEEFREMEA